MIILERNLVYDNSNKPSDLLNESSIQISAASQIQQSHNTSSSHNPIEISCANIHDRRIFCFTHVFIFIKVYCMIRSFYA